MIKFAAYFLFIVAMTPSAYAAFNFDTILHAAKECDLIKWKSLPIAKNSWSLDSSYAAFLADVKTQELSDSTSNKIRTDFSGKRIGGVVCRNNSYLDKLETFGVEPFHEIWTLEDLTQDSRYEGWSIRYSKPETPEMEGPSVLAFSNFWCIVRFEDFIKDYRAVPIDQLCKGESAQTKKKFIENLKRIQETMRKKVTSSAGLK